MDDDYVACSCGSLIRREVAEIEAIGEYSCSRSIRYTSVTRETRVSTVFFPHHLGSNYETLVFSYDGSKNYIAEQEWDCTEELALITHNELVGKYSAKV